MVVMLAAMDSNNGSDGQCQQWHQQWEMAAGMAVMMVVRTNRSNNEEG